MVHHCTPMMSDSAHDSLLQQELATLREMVEALKAENEQLKQHNHILRLKVDAMARKLFGRSSENLDPAQLQSIRHPCPHGTELDFVGQITSAGPLPALVPGVAPSALRPMPLA